MNQTKKIKPPRNFQEHLLDLDKRGLLITIDKPINKDTELQPLVRWQFVGGLPEEQRKAFLFTNVVDSKGKRYDMPVSIGAFASSADIYALGMGQDVDNIGNAWMHAIKNPIPPIFITQAPCQEVVIKGDDLTKAGGGLSLLPVPISTPGFDAAPYLTATLCISKDPETGIQNMGTYRAALKANDRLVVRMVARVGGAGGWVHWLKYREKKELMPMAIVIGSSPVVFFTGPQKLPVDLDEISVAGALAGEPIRMVKCVSVDLQVPADSEIVIEGLIDPSTLEPEAPFGESNGYVALEAFNMPMQVTAITHRKKAVFTAIISQVTPSESSVVKRVAYEPIFLHHLKEEMSIGGIKRVVMHEPLSNLRPVIFLQFERGAKKTEVWRGLHGASTLRPECGKIVVAVSEDIDPQSTDAVFWSMAYRMTPMTDVLLVPYRRGVQGSQYGPDKEESTLLIDATQKHDLAPLALPAKPYMQRAKELWDELELPPLVMKQPWHGYTLGDWNDTWEKFAQRAVAGDWESNGLETNLRRRGDVNPETPTSNVEKF
jgi:4-hydroxy-3-polyprenylbenzoate decarboxylase